MPLKKSKKQTHICKVCFREIKNYNFHSLFNNVCVCNSCLKECKPSFIKSEIDGIKCLSIYEYNEYMKSKFYLYKMLNDYELRKLFISPYLFELKNIYRGYKIIPIPSYYLRDNERGYNHVIEIFKDLGFAIENILVKTKDVEQKNLSFQERQKINDILDIKECDLTNKKILIVDDVITTGSTMKAAVKLIKNRHPKCIKILSVAKRVLNH